MIYTVFSLYVTEIPYHQLTLPDTFQTIIFLPSLNSINVLYYPYAQYIVYHTDEKKYSGSLFEEVNERKQGLVINHDLSLSMIALQSATKVPDPQSIPANAPEHCPVSSKVL